MTRASKRISPRKKDRFEVFKRDHFTCQYCGGQPPAVVLVVDHIDPVVRGGGSGMENLITSCEACNQGKGGRPLADRQIRPDADLLYLEVQQEFAELRRFREAVATKDAELALVLEYLREQWKRESSLPWAPGDTVLRPMLRQYSPDLIHEAVLVVAPKVAGGYLDSAKAWVPYMWGVLRTMARQQAEDDATVDEVSEWLRKGDPEAVRAGDLVG